MGDSSEDISQHIMKCMIGVLVIASLCLAEPEADPLHYYAPYSYPYFYRPYYASGYAGPLPGASYQSVHRLHKREAEADAQFAGPLTAAFGDLVSTERGLRPISLEGFYEDVNQDGFVDPIGQAVPVVQAPLFTSLVVRTLPAPVAPFAPTAFAAPAFPFGVASPVVQAPVVKTVVETPATVTHVAAPPGPSRPPRRLRGWPHPPRLRDSPRLCCQGCSPGRNSLRHLRPRHLHQDCQEGG